MLVLRRSWISLLGLVVLLGTGVAYLNANPRVLDFLPQEAQAARRALSGLLIHGNTMAVDEFATQQSDDFHRLLRQAGYEKWTDSVETLLFGNFIEKFDYEDVS